LGREISGQRNYSEKVATLIDKEVNKFIKEAESRAKKILIKRKKLLDKVAKRLIEKEIIEKEEFESLVGKKEARKKKTLKPKAETKKIKQVKVKVKRV